MRIRLFLILFFASVASVFGQCDIRGNVGDRQQKLPSATVILFRSDSVIEKATLTNIDGEFILEGIRPGNYLISVSMVGYEKFKTSVSLSDKVVFTLPNIVLEESVTQLDEVTVRTEKPVFEQQADRIVVNIQGSATFSGNTVLDVLQKSPGVVVNKQNNSISLNGRAGVRIMLDGKLIQAPLDVALQMLDGMSSNNIQMIELIHNPPAKFDADGSAGIIHILTKRNTDYGTTGSVGITAGVKGAETVGASFNISQRNKSLSFFLDYSYLRDHNFHTSKLTRQSIDGDFVQIIRDSSHRENITIQQNLSAGLEWRINEKTVINLGFTAYERNWDLTASGIDRNDAKSDSTLTTDMTIQELNRWKSATGAFGLQRKINTKSQIIFNVDYLYYNNHNPSSYHNSLYYWQRDERSVSSIGLNKDTPINFLIAKCDYEYSFSPAFSLEAGFKGVVSDLVNDVLAQRLINDTQTVDPDFTSYSKLNEQIGAAYASTRWQAGKQWQVNSGLRYEYTHTTISTPTQNNLFNRKYGYLFPSLTIKKAFSSDEDVQFLYSRRITRPTYNDIAPYVFFWGPTTFSSGNISLLPAISDAFKLSYHSGQVNVALHYTHSAREINSYQPEVEKATNSLIYRSQNLDYLNTIAVSGSYSFSLSDWWEVQSNVIGTYQMSQASSQQNNASLFLYGLNLNLTSVVKLPKNFSFEVSGIYQSKAISGITEYLPLGSLNIGFQKKLGSSGTLKLAMDDILYTNYWRIKADVPEGNVNTLFYYDFHNQYLRLTYSWILGNSRLKSVKLSSGAEEERKRVN